MTKKTSEIENCNNLNILYFEASTMKNLYENIKDWQNENKKRLLSCSIQKELDLYCCICLTNPMEVIICDGEGEHYRARVSVIGCLQVQ